MSQESNQDTLRAEYGFSDGITGAHYRAYDQATNVILLDPDVAAIFKDSDAVNSALRVLTRIAKARAGGKRQSDLPILDPLREGDSVMHSAW